MPFFHIGSEVYWIDATDELVENAFIISLENRSAY
jgi:hypothetical protein